MAIRKEIKELKIEVLPAVNDALNESNDGYATIIVQREVKFYGTGVDENDPTLPRYVEDVESLQKYTDYPNKTDLSNQTNLVKNVCEGAWT